MLEKYAMGREAEQDLVNFIYENKHKLREISLRMVLKIADLWKMAPDRYQHLAEQTCMRPGGIMQKRIWIATVIILVAIIVGNLGGLWLIGAI